MSSDQPKPTRPVSPPPPRPRRYDVTRSQVLSLAEQNAALQQRVDELEFVYKMSDATNDALRKDNASLLDDNVRIAQERDEATEALEQYALRTNQQIDAITQKLDTFTADNQRLRELLRRVADAAERDDLGSIGVELLEQIKHAIGRTGE